MTVFVVMIIIMIMMMVLMVVIIIVIMMVMCVFYLLNPACRCCCAVEIKEIGIENLLERHVAIIGLYDFSSRLNSTDDRFDTR